MKKTLKFILPGIKTKILGSSRTDAMVSANEAAFELFIDEEPLTDFVTFLALFNKNLPPDIRALDIKEVDAAFNIIQHPKQKEYLYMFSYGAKNHPFCAPLMANFQDDLDIEKMKAGAKLFEGTHSFKNYCADPSEKTRFVRTIEHASLTENTRYTASFFPEKSYIFQLNGSGFLRYQIRLMMGTLVQLGKGEIQLNDIEKSLKPNNEQVMNYIAPASGLILNKIDFE